MISSNNEWSSIVFGWVFFSIVFILFELYIVYTILFTQEPTLIKIILVVVSTIVLVPLCACLFIFLPDAWKECKIRRNK